MLGLFPGTAIYRSPEKFGLVLKDKEMLSCVSLQHPVAETEELSVREILQLHQCFTSEVSQKSKAQLQSIPSSLIRDHIKLQSHGVNTRWSILLMLYPAISTYVKQLKRHAFLSYIDIKSKQQLMKTVPYRTVNVLNSDSDLYKINNHPHQVLLNDIAGKIYELCSGKVSVKEMVAILRTREENLPPEPYFTEQVIETLKMFEDQFLIVFADF